MKSHEWFKHYKGLGYQMNRTKNGHYRVSDPAGRFVTICASTPSDWRATKNARARVRRHERNRAAVTA